MSMAFANNMDHMKPNQNKSRLVIIVLGIISLALLIAVIVLALRSNTVEVVKLVEKYVDRSICRGDSCDKSATQLENNMDVSVNPCEDFYSYSCGKVIKTEEPSPAFTLQFKIYNTLASILSIMKSNDDPTKNQKPHELAAFLYKSCIDNFEKDRLEELRYLIQDVGGWPLSGAATPASVTTIIDNNIKALTEYNTKILFETMILPNPVKPESFIMAITKDVTSTILPETGAFNYAADDDKTILLVKNLICAIYPKCNTFSNLRTDIYNILVFSGQIQYAQVNHLLDYFGDMVMPMSKLNAIFPGINFKNMIKRILPNENVIDSYQILADYNGLVSLFNLLNKTDKRVVQNWFIFQVVIKLGVQFSAQFRSLQTSTLTKEQNCANSVMSLMPYAAVDIYDEFYWSHKPGKKEKVIEIIKDMQLAVVRELKITSWMDNQMRTKLVEKVEAMIPNVGFPEWVKDKTALAEYYKVKVDDKKTYLGVARALLALNWPRETKKLKQKFVRESHWIRPGLLDVNAWYSPLDNTITVPLSFLDYPFFSDISQPRSHIFGLFAFVVGHEIFHGIDNSGIWYDKNGQLAGNYFNQDTIEKFEDKLSCLVEQYNAETQKGMQTISEDFPDNAASQMVFQVYKATSLMHDDHLPFSKLNITKDQEFFLSYASFFCEPTMDFNDVHSPGRYRVLIPLRNNPEFAKAFQCPIDSKMNPRKKCHVFE